MAWLDMLCGDGVQDGNPMKCVWKGKVCKGGFERLSQLRIRFFFFQFTTSIQMDMRILLGFMPLDGY